MCAAKKAPAITRRRGSSYDKLFGRSRHCDCIPIQPLQTSRILLVSCPVRGASRGDPEVGQSESWPEGAIPMVDAAPAAVPRKHRLGGPWVTDRAHYGALPSMAGRVPAKGGETCLDGEETRAGARKIRSQGRRSRRSGTPRGVAVCLCLPAIREIRRGVLQCAFRRPAPLMVRGEKNQKLTSRGGARMRTRGCLTFEFGNLARRFNIHCVIRGLDPRIHPSSQEAFFEEDGLPGQARQ
jgi:hypothetical protein